MTHRAIYEALGAGDGELAGDLIAGHIANAWAERKQNQARLDSGIIRMMIPQCGSRQSMST